MERNTPFGLRSRDWSGNDPLLTYHYHCYPSIRFIDEDFPMKAKLSIGSWAYIFNQETPTNDFHVVLHKLQDLGYDGVELGSFGVHPTPVSHPTKASRLRLKKEIADHGLALSGIA